MLDDKRADGRRSARAKVLLTAELECEGTRIPVRVANLSAHGALILGEPYFHEDQPVTFRCSGLAAEGWLAWVQPPYAGINFNKPIEPKDILPKARGDSTLVIKDTRTLDFRRPGFRGNQMSQEERQIVEQWQKEQFEQPTAKPDAADDQGS